MRVQMQMLNLNKKIYLNTKMNSVFADNQISCISRATTSISRALYKTYHWARWKGLLYHRSSGYSCHLIHPCSDVYGCVCYLHEKVSKYCHYSFLFLQNVVYCIKAVIENYLYQAFRHNQAMGWFHDIIIFIRHYTYWRQTKLFNH